MAEISIYRGEFWAYGFIDGKLVESTWPRYIDDAMYAHLGVKDLFTDDKFPENFKAPQTESEFLAAVEAAGIKFL